MGFQDMITVWESDLSEKQKSVLLVIAGFCKESGWTGKTSQEIIAKRCSISIRTVRDRLKELEEAGVIMVDRSAKPSRYMLQAANSCLLSDAAEIETSGRQLPHVDKYKAAKKSKQAATFGQDAAEMEEEAATSCPQVRVKKESKKEVKNDKPRFTIRTPTERPIVLGNIGKPSQDIFKPIEEEKLEYSDLVKMVATVYGESLAIVQDRMNAYNDLNLTAQEFELIARWWQAKKNGTMNLPRLTKVDSFRNMVEGYRAEHRRGMVRSEEEQNERGLSGDALVEVRRKLAMMGSKVSSYGTA